MFNHYKINLNLSKILAVIFLILAFIFCAENIQAQAKNNLDTEILVYIQPSVLEFPDGERGNVALNRINIKSQTLQQTFSKLNIDKLAKAFPNFDEADTIRVTDDGRIVEVPRVSRIFKIQVPDKSKIDSVIVALSKEPGVLFAEKNMDAKLFDDPTYSNQWHLNNTGQSGGTNDADIDAPEAWAIFSGSSSVKIAVIDAGVQLNHDDLSSKTTGDSFDPQDPEGYHGTHVAGIAAAKANNPYGGRGVDWNAQILSRQIFNSGGYMGDANTYNKVYDAVDSGANILNHSWGGTTYSTTVRLAFANAYKLNIVSVASMGNENTSSISYPAGYGQGIIAVGATD